MFSKRLLTICNRKDQLNIFRLDSKFSCKNISTLFNSFKQNSYENQKLRKFNINKSEFHSSSTFNVTVHVLGENDFARSVLTSMGNYSLSHSFLPKEPIKTDSEYDLSYEFWKNMSNEEILKNFKNVSFIANENQEYITIKYKEVLEVLVERVPQFNLQEIHDLLSSFTFWYTNKHFPLYENLYKAIDKQCIYMLPDMTIEEMFVTNDYLYKLRILRQTDFPFKSFRKIGRRIKFIPKENLVQYAYFMKLYQNMPVNMVEYEYNIEKFIEDLTVEELGVVAMGFFKQQARIKSVDLLAKIIQNVCKNLDTVSDYSLGAIGKILRYSIDLRVISGFDHLLKSLENQINQRDLKTLNHIAHMKARLLIHNNNIMNGIINRYENEISTARLKDIERLLYTLYSFNYDPNKCKLYSIISNELHVPSREEEINQFKKAFVYSIMYMVQNNYFEKEFVKKIIEPDYVESFCDKNIYKLNREYLIIDYCIELEHPEYNGPRLRKDILTLLIRKFGSLCYFSVKQNAKLFQAGSMMTETVQTCKELFGSDTSFYIDQVLPHFSYSYLIISLDNSNNYIPPTAVLENMPKGSIKYAPKDGNKWLAIIMGTHNLLTRNSLQYSGNLAIQIRHLKILGYHPVVVPYNRWTKFNEDEKKIFIKDLLYKEY